MTTASIFLVQTARSSSSSSFRSFSSSPSTSGCCRASTRRWRSDRRRSASAGGGRPGARRRRGGGRRAPHRPRASEAAGTRDRRHRQPDGRAGEDRHAGAGQAEYDRIVGNADVEIALARQRAVEEAAARMGEVVMEVVERVIGREVNLDVHRDLIDEAVTALREEPDGAAAGRWSAAVNPALQGYTAAIAEVAGLGRAAGVAADLEAIEQLVLANAQLRAALSDTAVPGTSRRAVMLDLLEGKVSAEARRVAAFASGAVAGAGGHIRPELAGYSVPAPLRGAGRRARAQPHGVAPTGRRLRHRRARGHVQPGARVARGRPLPLRPDRRVHAAPPVGAHRPRPRGGGAPGPGDPAARGQGSRRPRSGWSATWWPADGPRDFVGHARLPGREHAPRPAAGGSRGSSPRRPSTTPSAASCPSRSARWPVRRSSCRSRSTSRC